MSLLNLIRPLNLFLLAATIYFLDLFILQPLFNKYGLIFTLDEFHFFLLVLSIVLICAGGYVINDYFDVKADAINKPSKQIVGVRISQQKAFSIYGVLTIAGLLIGAYIAIRVGNWKLVTIHVISVFLLYTYSVSFQKIVLLGNFLVSLLSGLSLIAVGAFEPHIYNLAREGDYYAADICWFFILSMAVFAFLLTMAREIIKDLEDVEGDKKTGLRTLPVVYGGKSSVMAASFFLFAAMIGGWYFYQHIPGEQRSVYLIYFAVLELSFLLAIFFIWRAREKKDFSRLSLFLKFIMLLGICIMPLYYFIEF